MIDEAQRCWTRDHAVHQTRKRDVRLTDSEPGHLLDAMARRPGWAAIVCLVGGGQEIYEGEGGLAGWGEALTRRPAWRVVAAPAEADDPRRRLPPGLTVQLVPALHLAAPVRAVRAPVLAEWVDAVLGDDPVKAAGLAEAGLPFALTRSLGDMRAALRQRGTRTAGLVASSTARRLRAEGLGAVLPHQDDEAVARWFLDRWPDIRSSDALEVVGTEFAGAGAGVRPRRAVLGRGPRAGRGRVGRRSVGGAAVPGQRLDAGLGRGPAQPNQRLPRAADPRPARHHRLGAARRPARPHPRPRALRRDRGLPAALRHAGAGRGPPDRTGCARLPGSPRCCDPPPVPRLPRRGTAGCSAHDQDRHLEPRMAHPARRRRSDAARECAAQAAGRPRPAAPLRRHAGCRRGGARGSRWAGSGRRGVPAGPLCPVLHPRRRRAARWLRGPPWHRRAAEPGSGRARRQSECAVQAAQRGRHHARIAACAVCACWASI